MLQKRHRLCLTNTYTKNFNFFLSFSELEIKSLDLVRTESQRRTYELFALLFEHIAYAERLVSEAGFEHRLAALSVAVIEARNDAFAVLRRLDRLDDYVVVAALQ